MAYEQAQIRVQKAEDFENLRSAIERIFSSDELTSFYREVKSRRIGIRQFEKILELGLIEAADSKLALVGGKAREIFDALSPSDQAMMREFYLERIEEVDPELRRTFRRIYEYR